MKTPIKDATKTVGGLDVEIYTIDAKYCKPDYPVHGSIKGIGACDWDIDGRCYNRNLNLDLEQKSHYADWPIDARILVWDEGGEDDKLKSYFAGVNRNGSPRVWEGGATSFSSDGDTVKWDNAELYTGD